MHYVLRKTLGPLSGGTRVDVIRMDTEKWEKRGDTNNPGYATVRLANVSEELHKQIKHHPIYGQLLNPFDLPVTELVRRRS